MEKGILTVSEATAWRNAVVDHAEEAYRKGRMNYAELQERVATAWRDYQRCVKAWEESVAVVEDVPFI